MRGQLGEWVLPDPVRRRYAVKLGLALLVLAASIGAIGAVVTGEMRAAVADGVEDRYAELAAHESRSLEAWHRSNERTARSMSAAAQLRSGDRKTVRAYLARQRAANAGTVAEIHYVDLEAGRVVASTAERMEGRSPSAVDAPWTDVEPVGEEAVVSTTAYRDDSGRTLIAYVTGVDRQAGDPDGAVLVVTVDVAAYGEQIDGATDVHAMVVDGRGRIVLPSGGAAPPGGSTLAEYDVDSGSADPVSLARDADGGAGVVRTSPPDAVRRAMYLDRGEEVVVGYDAVGDTGWVVLVHAPAGSAYGAVRQVTLLGFGATGLGVLLVAAAGIAMGRRTARSIDRLTAKAQKVERGEYDVDLSTNRIDNLGRLYGAFDEMAAALADRERTLRSHRQMLENQRDRLVALFENANDPVARVSREPGGLVVREANAAFDRTFAADRSVPVSDDFEAAVDQPEGERQLSSIVDESGPEGAEREVTALTAEGPRQFLFRWIPFGDGEEGYATFTDITDRKERERELKRYESVIEALGDPVYAIDREGRITFVNEATLRTFGYEESELLGTPIVETMRDEAVERGEELIRELLAGDGETSGTIEYEMRAADGTWIPVENHVAVLEDDGEFMGTAGVLRDVTERKERETQLRRSEQRYRALVENSPAPIGIVMPDRTFAYCNRAGLEFLGADSLEEAREIDGLSVVHEDDREVAARRIGRVMEDRTTADPLEELFVGLDGTERVAVVTSTPITYEDQPAAMVVLNDVTERKGYERALRSLNDAARRFLNTETESEIAEVAADAAEAAIDADGCAVYLLDAEENRLDPVGFTPGYIDAAGGTPSVDVGDEGSAVWRAYLEEEGVLVTATSEEGDPAPTAPGTASGGRFVPLGDHGVFAALSAEEFDEDTERLIELLAATTEAAFDRLASESSLREREALLERQNDRLERQVGINRAIRDIQKTVTGASTREEIERGACRGLSDLDQFRFAWIGEHDPTEDRLVPQVWAGEGQGYLDDVTVGEDGESEPAWRTAATGETTVVPNVVDDVHGEPWRREAIAHEFNSVISVPLAYQDYTYGVLTVYADDPETFGSLERAVFEELGATIADAINAVETKRALYDDRALELKLALDPGDSVLGRIARETGGRVEFEGVTGGDGDGTRLFFTVTGADPERVVAVLEDVLSITDGRVVRESEDGAVFEATVEAPSPISTLVDHGGRLRSCVADGDGAEYVVDLPPEIDVREFVGMLGDRFPSVELVARRDVERSVGSKEELVETVLGELTDRQREVIATAYFGGFFEWPRESTGEDVAEMLGVSQPTINRHLRLAQRAILSELLGESTPETASVEE